MITFAKWANMHGNGQRPGVEGVMDREPPKFMRIPKSSEQSGTPVTSQQTIAINHSTRRRSSRAHPSPPKCDVADKLRGGEMDWIPWGEPWAPTALQAGAGCPPFYR